MSTLVLPDRSLVILVGAAGAGKSTLAARLFEPDEIVSSDALRAAVSGSEADQRASGLAFRILHRIVEGRLAKGETTVVDATNTKAEHRLPLITRARHAGVPVTAIVLDLPTQTVLAQNAARTERVVDASVVQRHLATLRRDIDQGRLSTEAIDHVVLLSTPEEATRLRLDRGRGRTQRVAPGDVRRRER